MLLTDAHVLKIFFKSKSVLGKTIYKLHLTYINILMLSDEIDEDGEEAYKR